MDSKGIVLSSLKQSFLIIKKSKKAFFLIFILQALFLSLVIAASSYYMPRILQSTQDVISYAEALNLNPESASISMLQQENPLGDDPLLISRNYSSIVENSIILSVLLFLIFAVINGLAWYFASNISEKGKRLFSFKSIFSYLSKFFIVSVALSLFLYLMLYNLANIAFSSYLSAKPVDFMPLLLIAAAAIYFIYIAVPILDKIKLGSLAKIPFYIGIRNFIPVMTSCLVILSLIILSLFLVFYFIEMNLFLLLTAVLLSVLVFAWSKVYFSIVVRKLSGF